MTQFQQNLSKTKPKKLKANAAFGVCGEANEKGYDKLEKELSACKTEEDKKKFIMGRREKLTAQLVTKNLDQNFKEYPNVIKAFKTQDVLPGEVKLEKFPFYMRLLFKLLLGIKKSAGELDQQRASENIKKFFENDVVGKKAVQKGWHSCV